jgi:hypothetical protein
MKKIILLFTILSLSAFIGQAQSINYFDNNPVWSIYSLDTTTSCQIYDTFIYYLNGDTLIGSDTYKKVFRQGDVVTVWTEIVPPDPDCFPYSYNLPWTYIRQDGQRILEWSTIDSTEKLIYDFSKISGDTIGNILVIDSLDSIYIQNNYRKLFHVHGAYASTGTYADTVIEGIGTNHGLFELFDAEHMLSMLTCFKINDTAYYALSPVNCDITVSIAEAVLNSSSEIYFFPNPGSEKIYINCADKQNKKIQIFNMLGESVLLDELKNGNNVVDIDQLPYGIYIIRIITADITILQKLIKE